MPRTVSLPKPSSHVCPVCDQGLDGVRCTACGADLQGPEGAELWRVDHELYRLSVVRGDLVARLLRPFVVAAPGLAPRPVPSPAAASTRSGPATPRSTFAPAPALAPTQVQVHPPAPPRQPFPPAAPPRPPGLPRKDPAPAARPARSGPSVAEVLVGLGGLSLVAAVVVFAAVTWSDLAAWAQGGLLLTATGLVLGAAVACRRRGLVATAEALGAVTVTLALADVQVARVGLDTAAAPRPVWAAGLALVAAGTVGVGRRERLRSLSSAGVALAFLPVPILATGASSSSALVWALGAQALIGAAAAGLLGRRPLERAVAAVGAALSWSGAVLGALTLAGAGLADSPVQYPLGPTALLAALALASVVVGQRQRIPALRAAGTALAFLPLVVLAVGTGSPLVVAWVLAGQALLAAAVTPELRSASLERALVVVGSLTSWSGATAGGLALGVAALFDDPEVVPLASISLLTVLALASLAVGHLRRIPVLVAAGAGLAFVPALFAAAAATPAVFLWVLVGESALAVALGAVLTPVPAPDATPDALAGLRRTVLAGAGMTWGLAAIGAVLLAIDGLDGVDPTVSLSAVAALLVLAAVSGGGAIAGGWSRDLAGGALVATVVATVTAAGFAQGPARADEITTTVAVTGGLLALVAAALASVDADRPWRAPMAAAGVVVGALALVPLEALASLATALADVTSPPAAGHVGQTLAERLALSSTIADDGLPTAATLGQLVSVALLALGGLRLRQRWGAHLMTAVALGVALAAPVALDLTVGATVAVWAALVTAGAVWLVRRPHDVGTLLAEAILVPMLVAVALASAPLAIGVTALVAGLTSGLAVLVLARQDRGATPWVAAALGALLGGTALDAWLLGADLTGTALALAAAAIAASAAAPAMERWARTPGEAVGAADGVVALALMTAAAAAGTVDGLSLVVAAIGLVTGLAAVRPTRRPLWLVAVAAGVVLTWMRLAVADVDLLEAYTLPLAAALLAAGLVGRRGVARSSWERVGAGLLTALGPSTYLALAEGDVTRTLAVVAAAVIVVLWGAVDREQAPLAIGGAALTAVAVRHLGPVATELPRSLVLAVAGIVLLATGATFEQRRQDLRAARDAFARLG